VSRVRTVDDIESHYAGLVQRLTVVLRDAEEGHDIAQEANARAWGRFDAADARVWIYTIGLRLILTLEVPEMLETPAGSVGGWIGAATNRLPAAHNDSPVGASA
jgi:hypothetical protein